MVKFSSIMIGLTQNKKNYSINTNNIEPQPFWDSSVLVSSVNIFKFVIKCSFFFFLPPLET